MPHPGDQGCKGPGQEVFTAWRPIPSLDHRDEQGQQVEKYPAVLHAGKDADCHHRQRDHQGSANDVPQEDLPRDGAMQQRPSGLRGTQLSHLCPTPAELLPKLCSVGDEDCQRGRVQLPPEPPGPLVVHREGDGCCRSVQSSSASQGEHQDARGFQRIQQQHAREHVGHATDDDEDEGGARSSSRRETSQEGQHRRDQHGFFQCCLTASVESHQHRVGDVKSWECFQCGEWQPLPEPKGRQLSFAADTMIPNAFSSLVNKDRTLLLEVACSPTSVLTETMQQLKKDESAARRCSLFNDFDLGTDSGVRKIIHDIDHLRPTHVWMSPICGPYSVMQNINQRTPEQCANLQEKRREALKQYVGCAIIFEYCVQKGIHVSWEWSQSCEAWRLPLIQRLVKKHNPYFSITRGCQVNLKDKHGDFVSKGWKIMTTNKLLADRLNLPCQCPKHVKHAKCEGSLAAKSAWYTPEMAKRACKAIIQGHDRDEIRQELQGRPLIPASFGLGCMCECKTGQQHDAHVTCGMCVSHEQYQLLGKTNHHDNHVLAVGDPQNGEDVAMVPVGNPEDGVPRDGQLMNPEEIKRKLYLLHAATGHGPIKHLVTALQRRGVGKEIIDLAKKFECSVCKERQRPVPRPLSTLEPLPPKWSVVSGDMGVWEDPHNHKKYTFLLLIDEGSRFRVCRLLGEGKKYHATAAQFISTFQECWSQYFGLPNSLRIDPDGTFRSTAVEDFCDRSRIFLDIIPGEAHWKLGVCEQAIQGTKEVMTKLAMDDPEVGASEILSEAVRTFNNRDLVRGYSPIQHALGRAPDSCDRVFPQGVQDSPELQVENSEGEMWRNVHRMKLAEGAFHDWMAQQRLLKAKNSRSRPVREYQPGDLVYMWRKQVSGKAAVKGGSFIGPARVLATEVRHSADGVPKVSSTVWCVRGRRLIKCCSEQLRHATEKEVILAELESGHYEDWTFNKVAQQLGGNEFIDISAEVPTPQEWERGHDPQLFWEPGSRCRGKRTFPGLPQYDDDMEPLTAGEPASSSHAAPNRSRSPAHRHRQQQDTESNDDALHSDSFATGQCWYEANVVMEQCNREECSFWTDSSAAIEIAIPMPETKNAAEKMLNDLPSFFASSLKRRSAVEISEKYLSSEDRQKFRDAKAIEVNNFLSSKAFEAIPDALKPSREQAIRMRWILTWKHKEDGSKKAKARAVLLGYQDPAYEHRSTNSPTTTRQTRQLQLQSAASLKFRMKKGDVTGAFLQSRPYPGELYCIPTPEICESMGLAAESITKVRRACYGLVDAPLEWYRSVCEFFGTIGLKRCWSDPCLWTYHADGGLKGIISAHVDDFLFTGDEKHAGWLQILEKIQKEYKWSDWEEGKFTQCGVQLEQLEDHSFCLSQSKYIDDLKYINLRAHRKKERNADTDEWEKTQLRALLGGISWLAQQTGPHFSGDVGFLLSEVNKSRIETIFKANKLLDRVKSMRDHKMKIHAIPVEQLSLYCWVDAGSQNRHDGSSTQGIVIGTGPKALLTGECAPVSLIAWRSQKIDRKCRSPGAAEALAAINGEDALFYARFQLAEMLGFSVDVRNVDKTVNQIGGCLISDSRNVYDKLETETLNIRGAEKRTDIEMLALKSAQVRNQVQVRWVHGEAQLANGLTKEGEYKELDLFYKMSQYWRLVEDSEKASARRQKAMGLDPLEERKGSSVEDGTVKKGNSMDSSS